MLPFTSAPLPILDDSETTTVSSGLPPVPPSHRAQGRAEPAGPARMGLTVMSALGSRGGLGLGAQVCCFVAFSGIRVSGETTQNLGKKKNKNAFRDCSLETAQDRQRQSLATDLASGFIRSQLPSDGAAQVGRIPPGTLQGRGQHSLRT